MLHSLRHPTFLIPALLLTFLVGLTVMMENRIATNNNAIRTTLNDDSTRFSFEVQNLIWSFHQELQSYPPETGTSEQFNSLSSRLAELKNGISEAMGYFRNIEAESDEQKQALPALYFLLHAVNQIQTLMPASLPLSSEAAAEIERRLGPITVASHEFSKSINKDHNEKFKTLFDELNSLETQRITLYILVFLCVTVLIAVSLYNARIYARYARIAHIAEQSNAMYAAALQSTSVGVLIRDTQSPIKEVVFVNNALVAMTGYTLSEIIMSEPGFLFKHGNDEAALATAQKALRDGMTTSLNLLTTRKNGSSFWSEWHLSPVYNAHGKLTHIVSLFADITSLRQIQEALLDAKERAEKANKIKSTFLATMSHEIRTPINGLLGILHLLDDMGLTPEQKTYVHIALTSGHALSEIINDILDYSKIEAGKLTIVNRPFSLRTLLQDVINLVQPTTLAKDIDLGFEIAASVSDYVVSDAGRIRQMLLNLVSNAIKFTDKGSVIIHVNSIITPSTTNQLTVVFDVIDSGCGIEPIYIDQLFKDFSQIENETSRRHSGSGLGLAITKRLAEMMGGEVGVESSVGKGSRFWFILPLALADSSHVEMLQQKLSPPQRLALDHSDKKILLVEDDATNQLVASSYLKKLGYTHDIASNGQDAINMVAATAYDLIFMDISMPVMDGLEATRRIRALEGRAAKTPIIALTAHALPEDRERCLNAGLNDFLDKPIDRDKLLSLLDHWLSYSSTMAEPVSQSTASSAPQPVLDKATLRRLVNDLDAATMFRITEAFLEDSEKHVISLSINFQSENLMAVQESAHAVKGSSANCGLRQFSELMAQIELAASQQDKGSLATLLSEAPTAYATACGQLLAERAHYLPAAT